MRALLMAALGLLASTALSGCDQVSMPKLSSATTTPCHCVAAAAPTEHLARLDAPMMRHHRYHRAHARTYSSHSYSQSWASEYEEQSSSYSSQSRSYSEGDNYRTEEGRPSHTRDDGWVDGYGRKHYGQATRVAADDAERLDPYHAYDKHCPKKDRE